MPLSINGVDLMYLDAQELKTGAEKYMNMGKFQAALQLFTRALDKAAYSQKALKSTILQGRADLKMKLGDVKGTVEDAEKAIQLDPSNGGAKETLSRAKRGATSSSSVSAPPPPPVPSEVTYQPISATEKVDQDAMPSKLDVGVYAPPLDKGVQQMTDETEEESVEKVNVGVYAPPPEHRDVEFREEDVLESELKEAAEAARPPHRREVEFTEEEMYRDSVTKLAESSAQKGATMGTDYIHEDDDDEAIAKKNASSEAGYYPPPPPPPLVAPPSFSSSGGGGKMSYPPPPLPPVGASATASSIFSASYDVTGGHNLAPQLAAYLELANGARAMIASFISLHCN